MSNTQDTENQESCNIIDVLTDKIFASLYSKKFWKLNYNFKNINIYLSNVLISFGVEKYNYKLLLNVELFDNNINNNIISKLESIEKYIHKFFNNLGLTTCVKKSKLGHIVRTHMAKTTEIYILKKNNEKMMIDESNLQNAECEIHAEIKGIWVTENNYGLYIVLKSIKVNKFN